MILAVGTKLIRASDSVQVEIVEIVQQAKRPGQDVYRLSDGSQLYAGRVLHDRFAEVLEP